VDGINVQPLDVDEIQIFTGQRYPFVVSIHVVGAAQPVDNYCTFNSSVTDLLSGLGIRALPNRPGDT